MSLGGVGVWGGVFAALSYRGFAAIRDGLPKPERRLSVNTITRYIGPSLTRRCRYIVVCIGLCGNKHKPS